jgi:hypothetical protein
VNKERSRVRISSFADAPGRTPLLRAPPRKLQGAVADSPMGEVGEFNDFYFRELQRQALQLVGVEGTFGKESPCLFFLSFFLLLSGFSLK